LLLHLHGPHLLGLLSLLHGVHLQHLLELIQWH
jgi:hypothetical protein